MVGTYKEIKQKISEDGKSKEFVINEVVTYKWKTEIMIIFINGKIVHLIV